jgi:hypothetical protein
MRGQVICRVFSVCLVLLPTTLFGAPETKWQDTFGIDKKNLTAAGSNAWFVLEPGYRCVFEGQEDGEEVQLTITVLGETKRVDGVETRVVEEQETSGGKPVEISRNYFAFDPATRNVYYFGEDVDAYKDGKSVNHDGGWLSGVKGAKYGLAMPGDVKVGERYYQEVAPGAAMDRAEIVSITEIVTVPAGTFHGCVKTEETTPLEPKSKEYKYYAPNVGLIQDGGLKLMKRGEVLK